MSDLADLRALDRRILALAVPALGALIVEPVYELTDTAVVGHLGRTPLVGLALAATVLNVVGWSAGFLTMATTSRVAFLRGRGDDGGVAAVVHAAYAVAAGLGVLLGVLVVLCGRSAADLLGGSGSGLAAATTYLRISAIGLPFPASGWRCCAGWPLAPCCWAAGGSHGSGRFSPPGRRGLNWLTFRGSSDKTGLRGWLAVPTGVPPTA